MPLLTGGAYAVSAALVIYADFSLITPQEWRLPLLIGWAVAGLGLALIGALRAAPSK